MPILVLVFRACQLQVVFAYCGQLGGRGKTPLAEWFSALVIAVVLVLLSTWFYYLPLAVLGAGVIVAVSPSY